MFYAIQHDEVLAEAASIPELKKKLLVNGAFDFSDEHDRTIIIAQRHSVLEVEFSLKLNEGRAAR